MYWRVVTPSSLRPFQIFPVLRNGARRHQDFLSSCITIFRTEETTSERSQLVIRLEFYGLGATPFDRNLGSVMLPCLSPYRKKKKRIKELASSEQRAQRPSTHLPY